MQSRAALFTLAALLTPGVLAGCGASDDGRVATGGPAPADTTSVATTAPTAPAERGEAAPTDAAGPMTGGGTSTVRGGGEGDGTALLADVRAAAQDGYDRVVFEFRGAVPSYTVEYANGTVSQDGSGAPVDVAGDAVLTVRMEPASDVDLEQATAPPTYTGPNRLDPGTPQVAEVVRTGGFEGVLAWAIGVRARADFKVSTLTDPPRVIVDVRAP